MLGAASRPARVAPLVRPQINQAVFCYRMHTSLLQKSAGTDSLVGIGLAEGDAMSMEVGLGRFGDRRLEKGGRHCMRRSFDGLVHAFGALPGTERRRFGSRVFYAMKG